MYHFWFSLTSLLCSFLPVLPTNRYYNTYISYGSGDTMVQAFHAHGGTVQPNRKWNLECLDGEAMIGIADWINDFIRLENVWCKFTFALKPPTNGLYPYYPWCHVRNYTDVYNCYDATRHGLTVNTFITAIWSANLQFWVHRIPQDNISLFKCCKIPLGYYLDYVSCYYVPTHDMYFEYYDNLNNFVTYCVQGYIMTAISKKINPYTKEYRHEWIQCCRVGLGHPVAHAPPVTYMPSGVPAYSAAPRSPMVISPAYQAQYRSTDADEEGGDGEPTIFSGFLPKETVVRNGSRRSPRKQRDLTEANRPHLDQLLLSTRSRETESTGLRNDDIRLS